jgi:hypothetical protein
MWPKGGSEKLMMGNPTAGEVVAITQDGCVGVGTANPDCTRGLGGNRIVRLHVVQHPEDPDSSEYAAVFEGVVRVDGRTGIGRFPAVNNLELEGTASKTTAGSWTANSDRRIKASVSTISDALETLERVHPVSFEYTDDYRAQHPTIEARRYVNVIAQEFAQVFPHDVRGGGDVLPNGEEILQADTYPLTIYSVAAIQELNRRLRDQESKIAALAQALGAQEQR